MFDLSAPITNGSLWDLYLANTSLIARASIGSPRGVPVPVSYHFSRGPALEEKHHGRVTQVNAYRALQNTLFYSDPIPLCRMYHGSKWLELHGLVV